MARRATAFRGDGSECPVTVEIACAGEVYQAGAALDGGPHIVRQERSVWGAFKAVRVELEHHGWFLALAGARLDCFPVGIERSPGMTAVMRFMSLETGEWYGIHGAEWFGLFEEAPRDLIGTAAEQESKYQRWDEWCTDVLRRAALERRRQWLEKHSRPQK
ncbi:hypothetical protein GTS_54700 [Gandjariella thermophila]|uniref:Uncharacterized protein n=1 Tax=Gandjariella thermophila TaxID=1931992 RepID=A0A4D4JIX0_9PSEU|nr:hypothetical protein GTS_54700 [Gandjariella thermophila]